MAFALQALGSLTRGSALALRLTCPEACLQFQDWTTEEEVGIIVKDFGMGNCCLACSGVERQKVALMKLPKDTVMTGIAYGKVVYFAVCDTESRTDTTSV